MRLCLAILACLCLAAPAAARDRGLLRLATQPLAPYQMIAEGQMGGIAVERLVCALDAMGQSFEIRMMDWSKAQLAVETGEYDAFFAGSANAARARYATPSEPVVTEDLAWYMGRTAGVDPNLPTDRMNARYAAKFATSKWLHLKKNEYNVVKKPRDAASLLNMLLVGDIDVALEYEMIFEHEMRARGLAPDAFRKVAFRRQSLRVHFANAFLNGRPAFLARFNAALGPCVERIR